MSVTLWCKGCRWCIPKTKTHFLPGGMFFESKTIEWEEWPDATCVHPDVRKPPRYLVTGDSADATLAEFERRNDGSCGPEGRLWESKP